MELIRRVFGVLSSFGLAVFTLIGMLVITFCGTIVQETTMSLPDAQRVYFESWFVMQPLVSFGGERDVEWFRAFDDQSSLVAPIPGGLLLMVLLSINLICGGIVRLRWRLSRVGILITHFGIAFLMIAGLVKFVASQEGLLALYEEESSAEYYSTTELEIVVMEPLGEGQAREYTFDAGPLYGLGNDERITLTHPDLPFELDLFDYMLNSRLKPKGPMFDVPVAVVDGYYLAEVSPAVGLKERNLSGCYATVRVGQEATGTSILWGFDLIPTWESGPWSVSIGNRRFGIKLRNAKYQLPYEVRVDDFRPEFHPGSTVPRSYESDVTVTGSTGASIERRIQMNDPLRRGGFILFQSSWGPSEGPRSKTGPYYSVFSVVSNPSDQWPMLSCWVIGIGLCLHFGVMLYRHIRRQVAEARA